MVKHAHGLMHPIIEKTRLHAIEGMHPGAQQIRCPTSSPTMHGAEAHEIAQDTPQRIAHEIEQAHAEMSEQIMIVQAEIAPQHNPIIPETHEETSARHGNMIFDKTVPAQQKHPLSDI